LKRFEREISDSIQTLKEAGALLALIIQEISTTDMKDSNLVLDRSLIESVLKATLQLEPVKRSLPRAIQLLTSQLV